MIMITQTLRVNDGYISKVAKESAEAPSFLRALVNFTASMVAMIGVSLLLASF
jgi:hypothetical protein